MDSERITPQQGGSAAVEAARKEVETALTNWRGVLTSSVYVGRFAAALKAQRAIIESLDAYAAACRAEGAAEIVEQTVMALERMRCYGVIDRHAWKECGRTEMCDRCTELAVWRSRVAARAEKASAG